MISVDIPSWQTQLRHAIREPKALLKALDLPDALQDRIPRDGAGFSMRVPRSFVARMRKGDFNDPLLRQVLPVADERTPAPCFATDPVGDLTAMQAPGVIHKYHGRVLLVTTGACAIHCRYCFRRHLNYQLANPARDGWSQAVAYISGDPSLTEVILSGGDPLSMTDRKLSALVQVLCEIPHIKRLRIHTRIPVVLPERVDDALLSWLRAVPIETIMVVHTNHPNEIDRPVAHALHRLNEVTTALLNQTVLLKGINDAVGPLAQLSQALFAAGTLPYYLHLLDRVQGAAHFEVEQKHAQEIMAGLRTLLPGYLVPRLVREVPGRAYKLPL
jgi:EF-P beta-lysylation protein EpmB